MDDSVGGFQLCLGVEGSGKDYSTAEWAAGDASGVCIVVFANEVPSIVEGRKPSGTRGRKSS